MTRDGYISRVFEWNSAVLATGDQKRNTDWKKRLKVSKRERGEGWMTTENTFNLHRTSIFIRDGPFSELQYVQVQSKHDNTEKMMNAGSSLGCSRFWLDLTEVKGSKAKLHFVALHTVWLISWRTGFLCLQYVLPATLLNHRITFAEDNAP